MNLTGSIVSLAVFAWILSRALSEADWTQLSLVSPTALLALLGCTILGAVVSGVMFWISIRPIKSLPVFDLQMLNLVGGMLNYAPLRLGFVARVAYHLHIDRLTLEQVTAWFSLIGYVMILGTGSCLAATMLHAEFDGRWLLTALFLMCLGVVAAKRLGRLRLAGRHSPSAPKIVGDPVAHFGLLGLHCIEIAVVACRMGAAALILGLSLPTSHVIALASSLIPFGRLGIREASVMLTAERISTGHVQLEATWAQLAIVESPGEAIIYIPTGGIALLRYHHRWLNDTQNG